MNTPVLRSVHLRRELLLGLALVVCVVVRVVVIQMHPPWKYVYSDMRGYIDNAERILEGKYSAQIFFQPVGFSAILALLKATLKVGFRGIATVHVVAGTLTAFFTGRITAHFAGENRGILATFAVALHFTLAYVAGYYMAETIYSFILTLAAWIAVTTRLEKFRHSFAFASVVGLGFWIKGFAAPVVAMSMLWFAYRILRERGSRRKWLRSAVLMLGLFVIQPLAHGEITHRAYGLRQHGPTTSGLNLVEGKCPSKKNRDSTGYEWLSPLYVQQGKTTFKKWPRPFTDAPYFQKEGLKCIKENPGIMLYSFRHVAELFVWNMMWPASGDPKFKDFERDYEDWFLAFLFPGLAVGLPSLLRSRRAKRHLFVLAICIPLIALAVTVYIFKSEIRYRLPFDPLLIVIASCGWGAIAQGLRTLWRGLRPAPRPLPPG